MDLTRAAMRFGCASVRVAMSLLLSGVTFVPEIPEAVDAYGASKQRKHVFAERNMANQSGRMVALQNTHAGRV